MAVFGKIASMLLLGAVGLLAGAVAGGIVTCYVYFIGAWAGALGGMITGFILGYRTPLYDSATLFVAFYGGGVVGVALTEPLKKLRPYDPGFQGLADVLIPAAGAVVGVILVFLPVYYLPPERRRVVAGVLAAVAALWLAWRFYLWAYVTT